MKKQKQKDDDRTKLILHFNVDKTIILKNQKDGRNVEYSLKKLFCSQIWGKIEMKGEDKLFKPLHPELEFDSSKILDSEMINYLQFIQERFPLKQHAEAVEDETYNKLQLDNQIKLIVDSIENGQPGSKFKKQFNDMRLKLRFDDKIIQDYAFKNDLRRIDQKLLSEEEKGNFNQMEEREKMNVLFKNSYYNIFVSFYNTILQLIKNKRRFVVIFRFFDLPFSIIEEVIFEFNCFCNGIHPKYSGHNTTQLQKLDGTNKNKDFRIVYDFNTKSGENVGFFIRNPKNIDKENLVWESLNTPEHIFDEEMRDNVDEFFEGDDDNLQTNVLISKGFNDILLSTYERLNHYSTLVFYDDSSIYNKTEQNGKLLVIDPYDYETLHILFDHGLDKDPNKVDVVDIATKKKLDSKSCLDKYLVNVDPRRAIIDINYFLSKIEVCEVNRQTEITKLTAKEFPHYPLTSDFDLKKEIANISCDSYLEMTIYPLLRNVSIKLKDKGFELCRHFQTQRSSAFYRQLHAQKQRLNQEYRRIPRQ